MMRPQTNHFCTYFDARYLTRGLALYESLEKHAAQPFQLWVLCLDDDTFSALSRLALRQMRLVPLAELEAADPELRASQATRSRIEYFWTCTPCWPRFIFRNAGEVAALSYVDADIFFFGDPTPVLVDSLAGSLIVVEHRFPPALENRRQFGRFNVGLVGFRRDAQAFDCLEVWRRQCIEWCYDRLDGVRYGDQKYLDEWPDRYSSTIVLNHAGANVAPWNWADSRFLFDGNHGTIDGVPLICYHFHGLRLLTNWLCDTGLQGYVPMRSTHRRWLYGQYLAALKRAHRTVEEHAPHMVGRDTTGLPGPYGWQSLALRLVNRNLMLRTGR